MRNPDPFADLIRSIEENLQRDDDWVPPDEGPPRRGPGGGGMPSRWWWLLVLPFVVLLLFNTVTGFFADWAWYDSLGFASVMWTRIGASWGLFLGGVAVAWLVLAGNIWIAQRTSPLGLAATPLDQFAESTGVRVPVALLAISGVFALFMGLNVVGDWSELLLFLNQRPFNVNDPIFGRDVSFYLFTLPILELVRGWLLALFLASLVGVTVVTGTGWRGWQVRTPVLLHMAILGALILALLAFGYQLEAAKLVYSDRGAVFGAGYTDVHAQLPAYNILTVVTLITAVLLIVTVFMRRAWRAIVVVLLVWLGVAVVAGSVYPGIVQRFQVNPNELSLERPYIEDNIRFTRVAYGLEDIDARNYDASQQLTSESLQKEPDTVRNIRLWDYRPLLETYNQVQALRQYYAFNDVDIDRYEIDGTRRQVTLSARELVADRLNTEAQTWVNRKLVYTHGYGVAASPVEQITADGLPMFYLKDLPTQGVFKIEVPQIYFGELANDYVIAGTRMAEFDYPSGSGNVTTNFTADTGIDMSFWHRALFALRFADINLVLNQDMTSESQLLWRRNIVSRARLLAPFFEYDHDPYIVIGDDGRLYWFIDGYAISDRYPYSEPYAGRFNYIRNAVKVVIDAYDGSMVFYVVDENEPITAAYQRIFPVLFRPLSEMPDYLLKHVRYPTDLFAVQAELYRTYHMTDATEFYNKEDMWAWPEEIFYSQPQPIEPYYVLMQLPDSDDLDYVQILPFTPANRENMIAWMAAHSDPEKYGQIVVYEFGKEALFFGPKQIEARVDQDPTISAQLSLWNQQGSNVIRGNLLVIPIGDSLLYVEPLYLQAQSGKIPELKRVILATADRVVMAENLGAALVSLFGRDSVAAAGLTDLLAFAPPSQLGGGSIETSAPAPAAAPTPAAAADLATASVADLIVRANDHYNRAQDYLRAGNWAAYGAEMDALQATLNQLVQLTGGITPTATPEPSASQ